GAVAVGTDRAFVGLGTATIALDRTGKRVWRVARTSQLPVGSPLASGPAWLVTHDPLPANGSTSGAAATPTYPVGLREGASGSRRWSIDYTPTPFTPPNGPPGGGPPGGPGGGPGGGGPRGNDEAWQRHEAAFAANQVIVRDAQEVRALALADGRQLW